MNRRSRLAVGWALAGLVLVATGVEASLRTTYPASAPSVVGTTLSYVEFLAGADSIASDHVSNFAIGTNRTKFSATLTGYGGAKVILTEFVKLKNVDTTGHVITLSGVQITNALVSNASLELFASGVSRGYLDLRSPTPTLALGNISAGSILTARVIYGLAPGAGVNNASTTATIYVKATP